MREQIIYICDYCGKKFTSSLACQEHEWECNKCNSCKHAYYVYGCEFACKYGDAGECGRNNNYLYFTEKSDKK